MQEPYGMDRCDYHQITFDYARICWGLYSMDSSWWNIIVNDEDEEEYDDETIESLSQYSAELDARMDPKFGNEQGGDAGSWDGNNESGANNDGGARVGDEDDLEDMIRALRPEILLKSPKGLENLEREKKHRRRPCMILTRVVRHTG